MLIMSRIVISIFSAVCCDGEGGSCEAAVGV